MKALSVAALAIALLLIGCGPAEPGHLIEFRDGPRGKPGVSLQEAWSVGGSAICHYHPQHGVVCEQEKEDETLSERLAGITYMKGDEVVASFEYAGKKQIVLDLNLFSPKLTIQEARDFARWILKSTEGE